MDKVRLFFAVLFVVGVGALPGTSVSSAQAVGAVDEGAGSWTIRDLGTLGGAESAAVDISESGHVVGDSLTSTGDGHAFLWTRADGMVDLGTLPGGRGSGAIAVNALGQVVGYGPSNDPENLAFLEQHAFSWTRAGGMVDLGTLGGEPPFAHSYATAVNTSGQVVGRSSTETGQEHAFLWTEADGMVDLGTLPGLPFSEANAINDAGQVVGVSYRFAAAGNETHAFLWTQTGGMVDLGALGAGGRQTIPMAITNSGLVVGISSTNAVDDQRHAFAWTQTGGMIDLDSFGSPYSHAFAASATGQVAGIRTINAAGPPHAFSWTQAGGMVDLGLLDGGTLSFASALNASGVVIGYAQTADSAHAFAWTQAGGMVDLGTLGGDFSAASQINDRGEIAGWSKTASGQTHAALWEPAGATGQLAALYDAVQGVGPGTSLADKLSDAQDALASNDVGSACSILRAFINQVKAQAGKKIQADTAASLVADANRIRAVLGC